MTITFSRGRRPRKSDLERTGVCAGAAGRSQPRSRRREGRFSGECLPGPRTAPPDVWPQRLSSSSAPWCGRAAGAFRPARAGSSIWPLARRPGAPAGRAPFCRRS
eukprot:10903696-Lingulodinium_polyedra.AAC.1